MKNCNYQNSYQNISKLSQIFSVLMLPLSFLDKVEIINSFTGKTVCNKYSRLTKQNMFRRFGRIVTHLPNIVNRPIDKDYCEEKASATEYQVNKFALLSNFAVKQNKLASKNILWHKKTSNIFHKQKKKSASIYSTTIPRFYYHCRKGSSSFILHFYRPFFHLKASSNIHFHFFFSFHRFRMRKANSSRRSIAKNWEIGWRSPSSRISFHCCPTKND